MTTTLSATKSFSSQYTTIKDVSSSTSTILSFQPEYSPVIFRPTRKYPYKGLQDCLETFPPSVYNIQEPYCNATYDSILCWPPTRAGIIIKQSCPPLKGIDTAKFATRKCSFNGQWLDRYFNPVSSTMGWTNFTLCYRPETDELYKKIRPHVELFSKVSYSTRIMEMVGLSISLLSLLIALVIFSSFRSLKNDRTKIHRNLFVAMTMLVLIRLILYSDQFATKSVVLIGIPKTSHQKGIDNTEILCESFYIVYEYAKTVLFMWMLVEGFYLHHVIVASVFETKPNLLIFQAVGWGVPLILTSIWAGVYSRVKNKSTCWFMYSFAPQYWILEGPRIAVIIINLLFLLNIIRVLVSKLRDTNSTEAEQAKKAVKAALVLLPLLGITNSINLLPTPWKLIPFVVWMYGAYFLISFQGLFVSLIYCFCNQEVRGALKSAWRRRSLSNTGIKRFSDWRPSTTIREYNYPFKKIKQCHSEILGSFSGFAIGGVTSFSGASLGNFGSGSRRSTIKLSATNHHIGPTRSPLSSISRSPHNKSSLSAAPFKSNDDQCLNSKFVWEGDIPQENGYIRGFGKHESVSPKTRSFFSRQNFARFFTRPKFSFSTATPTSARRADEQGSGADKRHEKNVNETYDDSAKDMKRSPRGEATTATPLVEESRLMINTNHKTLEKHLRFVSTNPVICTTTTPAVAGKLPVPLKSGVKSFRSCTHLWGRKSVRPLHRPFWKMEQPVKLISRPLFPPRRLACRPFLHHNHHRRSTSSIPLEGGTEYSIEKNDPEKKDVDHYPEETGENLLLGEKFKYSDDLRRTLSSSSDSRLRAQENLNNRQKQQLKNNSVDSGLIVVNSGAITPSYSPRPDNNNNPEAAALVIITSTKSDIDKCNLSCFPHPIDDILNQHSKLDLITRLPQPPLKCDDGRGRRLCISLPNVTIFSLPSSTYKQKFGYYHPNEKSVKDPFSDNPVGIQHSLYNPRQRQSLKPTLNNPNDDFVQLNNCNKKPNNTRAWNRKFQLPYLGSKGTLIGPSSIATESDYEKGFKFEGVKVYLQPGRTGFYEGRNETSLVYEVPESDSNESTHLFRSSNKLKKSESSHTCFTNLTNSPSESPL